MNHSYAYGETAGPSSMRPFTTRGTVLGIEEAQAAMSSNEQNEAVRRTAGRAELEASGGVNLDTVREIALTGVDFISVGQLTKDVTATDYSMLFTTD